MLRLKKTPLRTSSFLDRSAQTDVLYLLEGAAARIKFDDFLLQFPQRLYGTPEVRAFLPAVGDCHAVPGSDSGWLSRPKTIEIGKKRQRILKPGPPRKPTASCGPPKQWSRCAASCHFWFSGNKPGAKAGSSRTAESSLGVWTSGVRFAGRGAWETSPQVVPPTRN